MLPPDFAAFGFVLDRTGTDEAVASRAAAAFGRRRRREIAVVGARRWGLLAALVRRRLDVTGIDASRAVLGTARRGLEESGLGGRVTLFAGDPRDIEIPGGTDAALLTSAMWRLLLHEEAQTAALRSLARALRDGGTLLLDLDRVPRLPRTSWRRLRDGPGRQEWDAQRHGDHVRVRCRSLAVPEIVVDLAATQPEGAAALVRRAGYEDVVVTDAEDGGPLRRASARMWLVARAPRRADPEGRRR